MMMDGAKILKDEGDLPVTSTLKGSRFCALGRRSSQSSDSTAVLLSPLFLLQKAQVAEWIGLPLLGIWESRTSPNSHQTFVERLMAAIYPARSGSHRDFASLSSKERRCGENAANCSSAQENNMEIPSNALDARNTVIGPLLRAPVLC